MEVFYIEAENKTMYIDFFTKNQQIEIVENFFIKGGLLMPKEVDPTKTIEQLDEKDFTRFFEELGYEVTGFSIYDKDQHHSYSVPWPDPLDSDSKIEEG